MFEGWDSFYLLVGGAAGALIGLLFIVVTLIRDRNAGLNLRNTGVYMTPTVAHLAMVLLLSALATAPGIPIVLARWVFAACALACLGFTLRSLWMFLTGGVKATHWSDLWAYGVAPFVACSGLLAAASAFWYAPVWGARGVAGSVMLILLIAIRNAWDLVTWIGAQGANLGKTD